MKRILLMLALGLGLACSGRAQELIRTAHPRLLLDDAAFGQLRDAVLQGDSEPLTLLHEACMAYAEATLSQGPVVYEKDASGRRILGKSQAALGRIFCCAYAWRFTGEERFLRHAERDMLDVCAFPDWNPTHFLDVGEMAAAVGLGYDWLYPALAPSTRELAVRTLRDYAFAPARNPSYAWFYHRTHNWNQVCNGGLVCAALATFESHPAEARALIRKAVKTNRPAMVASYSPDGNYTEGPSYWEYGTLYETFMLSLLESCLGTDYGLGSTDGFLETPRYILFSCGTTHRQFNYYDNGLAEVPHCGMWYFAARENDASLLYNELRLLRAGDYRRAPNRFLPLLVYYASQVRFDRVDPPSARVWAGRGETPVVLIRTGWDDGAGDRYLGVKGGQAGTNHGHMDAGSFVYDARGIRWAADLGNQPYAQTEAVVEALGKDLWDRSQTSCRWQLFRYNNRQHNTLTVNGRDHRVDGAATLLEVLDGDGRLGARLDLTPVFGGDLALAERTVELLAGDGLSVSDRLAAPVGRAASVRWTLVTEAEPTLTDGGIILERDGIRMLLQTQGAAVTYRTWSADPADYASPLAAADVPNPSRWLCGFETVLPPGTPVTLITTLTRIHTNILANNCF